MKVCLVTPRYPPNVRGGGEISVQLLAGRLDTHPNVTETRVVSFDGNGDELVNGVRVNRIGTYPTFPLELSNPLVAGKLLSLRRRLAEFDLLHGYNVYYYPALGVVSSVLSVPSVATLNSYALLPKSAFGVSATGRRKVYDQLFMPTTGRLLRRCARNIDRFICLSDGSKRVYAENGFNRETITTIPNMVDPSFDVSPRSGSDATIRVLYVGGLIERKGVRHLVAAARFLPPRFEIRIVGEGNQAEKLKQDAIDLGVANKIEFVGRIPYEEIKHEYAEADLFVHPGIWPEPFGRTILEAMQAELPVVSTAVGGPAEVVTDDDVLCQPADPRDLAEKIQFAATNGTELGRKNRAKVTTEYSPDRIVDRILTLYADLLEE